MAAGALLIPLEGSPVVPGTAPAPMAVAPNYEVFDGLGPLDHAVSSPPVEGSPSRPGGGPGSPDYTPGPVSGVRGVVGGMPLPVADPLTRPPGEYTPAGVFTVQYRLGVGQQGPSALGVQNTLQGLAASQPPIPTPFELILSGQG